MCLPLASAANAVGLPAGSVSKALPELVVSGFRTNRLYLLARIGPGAMIRTADQGRLETE
jgi:hypothetical protein